MGRTTTWGLAWLSLLWLSTPVLASDRGLFEWGQNRAQPTFPIALSQTNAPEPHAPASYHRSIRHYYYFPSVCVYHDADRGLYFYPRGSEWRIAVSLPSELRMQLGDYVTFEIAGDKPYILNAQHQKQYPPGPISE